MPSFDTELNAFIETLSKTESILAANGCVFWGSKIKQVLDAAKKSDGWCVEKLLGFYGGMGSFNDLVIGSKDADDELYKLRMQLYESAMRLKRFV